jgi:hypothetical protein
MTTLAVQHWVQAALVMFLLYVCPTLLYCCGQEQKVIVRSGAYRVGVQ